VCTQKPHHVQLSHRRPFPTPNCVCFGCCFSSWIKVETHIYITERMGNMCSSCNDGPRVIYRSQRNRRMKAHSSHHGAACTVARSDAVGTTTQRRPRTTLAPRQQWSCSTTDFSDSGAQPNQCLATRDGRLGPGPLVAQSASRMVTTITPLPCSRSAASGAVGKGSRFSDSGASFAWNPVTLLRGTPQHSIELVPSARLDAFGCDERDDDLADGPQNGAGSAHSIAGPEQLATPPTNPLVSVS
jgi:hypothetical protein